ncbi:MAG: dihydrodipicolinate synthase family protein, partial [Anaerolineae bacterium]
DLPRQVRTNWTADQWVEAVRTELRRAVADHMVSDVPIGAFLSGGIDSSAVVALMAEQSSLPVNTYSIGYGGSATSDYFNELEYAGQVARLFKTSHHEIVVAPDVARLLPKLLWHVEEPISDSAVATTFLVAELAAKSVKVILSGVGGDELFAGYRRYLGDHYAGADAVIAMPPWSTKLTRFEQFEAYYRAIADACGLPVFVQNVGAPLGSSLPARSVVELCERIPLVQYLKEEKDPQGQSLSEVIDLHSPAVRGVFSGSQCMWLLADHARGASGSMPASHMVDVDVRIWNLLEAGDLVEAQRVHRDKMVLENALTSMRGGWRSAKEVLRRRGVISSAAIRNQGPMILDDVDRAQLDYALSIVEPYFTL